MSRWGKKTLIQLIGQVSQSDLDCFLSELQNCSYPSDFQTIFLDCFPGSQKVTTKEAFSTKYLAKIHKKLSSLLIEFLGKKHYPGLFSFHPKAAESRHLNDLGLAELAFETCISGLEISSEHEDFSQIEYFYESILHISIQIPLEKVHSNHLERVGDIIVRARAQKLEYDAMQRIFTLGILAFRRQKQVEGKRNEELLNWIHSEVGKSDYPTWSIKAKFLHSYILGFLYMVDYHRYPISGDIEQAFKIYESNSWLASFVQSYLPNFHLMVLNQFCLEGREPEAENVLKIIEKRYQNPYSAQNWQVFLGSLTIAESFDNKRFTSKAENLFNLNWERVSPQLLPAMRVSSVFFLLKLKIKHSLFDRILTLFQICGQFNKNDQKLEAQIYFKILEVVYYWKIGDLHEVNRLSINALKVLRYYKLTSHLPLANLTLKFFATISTKSGSKVKDKINRILDELKSAQNQNIQELSYFNLIDFFSKELDCIS